MEVLINIMAISEHDNASDMAIQNQQDNLKTFQDYAMDIWRWRECCICYDG